MADNLENLRKQVDELFEKKEYFQIVELLSDDILEKYKDASLYAWRARAHHGLNQYEKQFAYAQKAIDADENFWLGYFVRANFWRNQGDLEKAIADYSKVISLKPEYHSAYINRGVSFKDKGEHINAINDYTKAIELKPDNEVAYYYRALELGRNGKHEEAFIDFTKAIELKPDSEDAYLYRGNLFFDTGSYDKAISDYNKTLELRPNAAGAFYNRGLSLRYKGEYDNAIDDFKHFLEFTDDKTDVWTKRAKGEIDELTKLVANKKLSAITDIINSIKTLLLFEGDCITHYTSLSATKAMLLENSAFRISEGAFLNDTSEGRELFKFLGIHFSTIRINDTIAEVFAQKPFIGSFVEKTKHDDLNLWRMYGKENKEEAKGCALTMKVPAFIDSVNKTFAPDEASKSLDDINFYRVAYRSSDNLEEFVVPEITSKKNKELNRLVKTLKKKVEGFSEKSPHVKDLEEYINSIAFLFKSNVYRSENELRLVVKGVGFKKEIDIKQNPPRVYIELLNVKPVIEKITLGPKVDRPDEWAAAFYYNYDKEDKKPEILISHLPFK